MKLKKFSLTRNQYGESLSFLTKILYVSLRNIIFFFVVIIRFSSIYLSILSKLEGNEVLWWKFLFSRTLEISQKKLIIMITKFYQKKILFFDMKSVEFFHANREKVVFGSKFSMILNIKIIFPSERFKDSKKYKFGDVQGLFSSFYPCRCHFISSFFTFFLKKKVEIFSYVWWISLWKLKLTFDWILHKKKISKNFQVINHTEIHKKTKTSRW